MGRSRKTSDPRIERVRERLDRSLKLRGKLAAKYERLDALTLRLSSPSSPRWDAIPGGGTPNRDRLADGVAQKIELEQQIERLKQKLRADVWQLTEWFEKLPPRRELVMCLRYVDGLDWKEVNAAMHDGEPDFDENIDLYTHRTFLLHGQALSDLAKLEHREEPDEGNEEEGGAI